eukprot:6186611-Pleurochrysis_carterae.AAC.3
MKPDTSAPPSIRVYASLRSGKHDRDRTRNVAVDGNVLPGCLRSDRRAAFARCELVPVAIHQRQILPRRMLGALLFLGY